MRWAKPFGRRVLVLVVMGALPVAGVAYAIGDDVDAGREAAAEAASMSDAYARAEENAIKSAVQSARVQIDEQPSPTLYDGRGEDSPWSLAEGGRRLEGGGMVAEVGLTYVRTSADGAHKYEVYAVGIHNGVKRSYTAPVYLPAEGRSPAGEAR